MAELLLKVKSDVTPEPSYQDGDIVCAFNNRRVQITHAQHICHPWQATATGEGLLPMDTHIQKYFEITHQYKFVRDGSQVTRITLATEEEEDVSNQMDAALYIARRKAFLAPNGTPQKPMFGTVGQEIWYGGRNDYTKDTEVWNAIEQHTSEVRGDYMDWPITSLEKKHFLVVPTVDFSDALASQYVEPEVDDSDPENPVTVKKRKRKIDYTKALQISGATLAKVNDPNIEVDKPTSIEYDLDVITTK